MTDFGIISMTAIGIKPQNLKKMFIGVTQSQKLFQEIKPGTNGWFESSPDSSFSLGCNAKHERPETNVKEQPRTLQLRYVT